MIFYKLYVFFFGTRFNLGNFLGTIGTIGTIIVASNSIIGFSTSSIFALGLLLIISRNANISLLNASSSVFIASLLSRGLLFRNI